ncbi:hypothetical protein BD410DRAFT_835492 [Rickenella mellea]|uniref:Uncharacterized protein n=1 Tax=Rickenella mellea TaxID=50990 RepID=A0A4Y7QLM5_9AGAM|nr:hypothetical protein BD410DRAFT_835492 [Rickenella mellea]
MWEDAYKQPTTAEESESFQGTQPSGLKYRGPSLFSANVACNVELNNDYKQPGEARDAIRKRDWLLVIPSISDVYDRLATLDGEVWLCRLPLLMVIQVCMQSLHKSIKNWRKDHEEPHVWDYGRAEVENTCGGFMHLKRQDDNMVAVGHSVYIDLCMNLNRIQRLNIIGVESGAYLAVRLIEFIDRYGTKFEDDMGGFADEWASFLWSHGHATGETGMQNAISPLIRSVILVQPSLPIPSGLNKWMWWWLKPAIYDHLEWSQPSEYDILDAKAKRRRYSIVTFERSALSNASIESDTQVIPMDLPNDSSLAFDVQTFQINDISLARSDLCRWLEDRLRDASA